MRTLWMGVALVAVTLWWGPQVLAAALLKRKPGGWYVDVSRKWARSILRASGCPVVAHGREHVRPGEPLVVAANHVSWFDIFAIAASLEVPFHFVAKKELEKIPLFGPAWQAAGHISIDRSHREAAIRSLRAAGEKIRRDRSVVVIYPEGTRSRTGRLLPFKKGAFMLAVEAQVPVVPTVVTGAYEIMPPGAWRIRPNTMHVHFLPPIVPPPTVEGVETLMAQVRAEMLTVLEGEEMPPDPDDLTRAI
ncbi:MAG TPA: lysophospholipid acyltransferase family protein [Longimicrobiaceae bacterium]|nr:lysophospholipid acyltransferase family protein [Longimicrobiaceae bacterium]